MKRFFLLSCLIVGLISLCTGFQTGCIFFSDSDSGSMRIGTAAEPVEANASVRFQVVVPQVGARASAASGSITLPENPTGILSNILPSANTATPAVTFSITLVNIGNASTPTTLISKTVPVSSNGTAVATFTFLPPTTCIGHVSITGGRIGGYSEFRGAADLNGNATNTLIVNPVGSNMQEDVVAQVVEYVVSNPTMFSRINLKFSNSIRLQITDLDQSSATYSQDAITRFIQYLCPPKYTITPATIRQAQSDLVQVGALPNDPASFWVTGFPS